MSNVNFILQVDGDDVFYPDGAIEIRETNVSNPFSALFDSETCARFSANSSNLGGLNIFGVTDAGTVEALILSGYLGAADPTDTITAVEIQGAKYNGAGNITTLADAETVLNVVNNATKLLTVLGSGNVGIGTIAPTESLEVLGSGIFGNSPYGYLSTLQSETDFVLGYNCKRDAASGDDLVSGPTSSSSLHPQAVILGPQEGIRFITRPDWPGVSTAFDIDTYEKMRITPAGNVGVGTTSPNGIFEVQGGQTVFSDSGFTHPLTTVFPVNAYGFIENRFGSNGNLFIAGCSNSASTEGLTLQGTIGNINPNDDVPAVEIKGQKYDGGSSQANLDAGETVFKVLNRNTDLLTVLGSGFTGFGTVPAAKIDVRDGDLILTDGTLTQPITDTATNRTFFKVNVSDSGNGGAEIYGLTDDQFARPLKLFGYFGNSSVSGVIPGITLEAAKTDGSTGTQALSDTQTILSIRNDGLEKLAMLGNGDLKWNGDIFPEGTLNAYLRLSGTQLAYVDSSSNLLLNVSGTQLSLNFTGNDADTIIYGNSGRLITADAGLDEVTIGEGTPAGGNCSLFETDGTLVFQGDATVWNDLNIPLTSAGRTTGSLPGLVTYDTTSIDIVAFDQNTVEEISSCVEIPHDYKEGTDLVPHIHWTPTTANNGTNVLWKLEYLVKSTTSTVVTGTVSATGTSGTTSWEEIRNNFTNISGTGLTIGMQLIFRLYRDATDAADTYNFDAGVFTFGFHYEADTVGSRQITSK